MNLARSFFGCVYRFQLPVLGQARAGQTACTANDSVAAQRQTCCNDATMREEGISIGTCTCSTLCFVLVLFTQ